MVSDVNHLRLSFIFFTSTSKVSLFVVVHNYFLLPSWLPATILIMKILSSNIPLMYQTTQSILKIKSWFPETPFTCIPMKTLVSFLLHRRWMITTTITGANLCNMLSHPRRSSTSSMTGSWSPFYLTKNLSYGNTQITWFSHGSFVLFPHILLREPYILIQL